MKRFYTLILLIGFISSAFAQIPANYYNQATGTGYTLKTQLYNIIKNHTNPGYSGLYTTYTTSDRDYYYENDATLLDMYSENPNGNDSYVYSATNTSDRCGNYSGEGDCYNREHIIPQSVFDSASPMYSDAHFVVPSDGYVNGVRGNLPFGVVANANYTSENGSKRGGNLNSGYSAGYSGTVFEPIDEFKGDIARMVLYFATRYQNQVASWNFAMFNNTSNQVFTNTSLNILLTWHLNDPVDQREIDRNNAIYARQNNRNPFIDHPEYACEIWTAACAALGTVEYEQLQVTIYPNPSSTNAVTIQTENLVEQIELFNINGQIVREVIEPVASQGEYVIDNLPSGFYLIRISGSEGAAIRKVIIY